MKPEEQLFLQDKLKEERKQSNEQYAIKLVEKAFFTLIGVICLGFIGFLIRLVFKS